MQTFTAGRSGTLSRLDLTAFQETTPTGLTGGAGPGGTPVNGSLTLSLATLDSAGRIGQILATETYPAANVGWAPENLVLAPDIAVVGGRRYAVLASSDTTGGCYGFAENTGNPYHGGSMATSTDGGATFTASPSTDLKFYTTVVH